MPRSEDAVFRAIHALALRGRLARLHADVDADALVRAGFLRPTADGFELTFKGHSRHRALLQRERSTLDVSRLELAYARFPALVTRLKMLRTRSDRSGDTARRSLARQVAGLIEEVEVILRGAVAIAPRFADYLPRLEACRHRLQAGELDYALSPDVESVAVLVAEVHEDFLQTLGVAPAPDDL